MDKSSLDLLKKGNSNLLNFFQSAVVIFDSSALLDLYNYPVYTRQPLYNQVFSKLKGRLWIPSQVEFEYIKNREKVIKKPIDVYENLITKISKNTEGGFVKQIGKEIDIIKNNNRKNISGNIQALKEITQNADKHPHIDHEKIRSFDKLLSNFDKRILEIEDDYNDFCKEIETAINVQVNEVNHSIDNDDVLNFVLDNIDVGKSYTYDKLLEVCKVGHSRYELQIPPGYLDDEKIGMQKYGDLILWMQIIDYVKNEKIRVIFVTNDSKPDWWEYQNKISTNNPRIELLKEFLDKTSQEIHFTDSNRFYRDAKKYLQLSIDQSILDTIIENSQMSIQKNQLITEVSFYDWLREKSRLSDFNFNVNYNGREVDVLARSPEDITIVFEIKKSHDFNKIVVDNTLKKFLSHYTFNDIEDTRSLLTLIYDDKESAVKSGKYLDMYVVESRKDIDSSKILFHVVVGYMDSGRFHLVYSDYQLIN